MRRKDREVFDLNKIEEILLEARYLHLGMFDGDYPYVVPLHYGYLLQSGKLTFFFHCAKEGHKLDCLRNNDKVFAEIDCNEKLISGDVPCRYGAEYKSVMCRGRATIINNPKDKCQALELIMKVQTAQDFKITEAMADTVNVVKIDVESYTAKMRTI